MEKIGFKKIIIALILIVAIFAVFLHVGNYFKDPKIYEETTSYLDEKRVTVLELSAASIAASTAASMIPGDGATPIANKLADLSGYFLIIMVALFLEKYLLVIGGYAAVKYILPFALILIIVNILKKNDAFIGLAKKLIAVAIIILLVVPASVGVSRLIEDTYQTSIDNTLKVAEANTEAIENYANGDKDGKKDADKGFFPDLVDKVSDGVDEIIKKAGDGIDAAKNMFNYFLEAAAVLIVTTCVIPILVMLFLFWAIKSIFGLQVSLPKKLPKASNIKKQLLKEPSADELEKQ